VTIVPIIVEEGGEDALLKAVIALGRYSHEADPELGHRRHRSHTEVGTLLNQAKYHPESPRNEEAARSTLHDALIDVLCGHPLLNAAGAVVAVPGGARDFSNCIAADLRLGLGIPVYVGRARVHGGRAAKNHSVKRDYIVDESLDGTHVVIFDDVYDTGGSLRSMAQAALRAGAKSCSGLVIAQRMP
jgi:phosphoribosylpyrophosphate synthetase